MSAPEPRLSPKEHEIMSLLMEHGESFGQQLVALSEGALARGTIYVTLQRLEKNGLVTSRPEERNPGAIGLPRRLYTISALGRRVVEAIELGRAHLAGLLPGGAT